MALARILLAKPRILMLDEPFSALDAFLKEKLQLELLELLSGYDKDILMVTHSRDEIYRFCEHMLIVEDGRQAGFGITKEIFKNPGTPAAAKLTGWKIDIKSESQAAEEAEQGAQEVGVAYEADED